VQIGAVAFRNPPGEGKTEARACWSARACCRNSVKAIKNPEPVLESDSKSGVAYRENNVLFIGRCAELNCTSWRRVLARIL
jgi:hypothetical protein